MSEYILDKTLFIIRGLPGTGKSTLAHQLTPWVCEADQYFTKPDGRYEFDPAKLPEAHAYCEYCVEVLMRSVDNITKIAVSNTGSQRWEFQKYVALAQRYGYKICEITLTGDSFGSIHNVPDEAVERMKARWEK